MEKTNEDNENRELTNPREVNTSPSTTERSVSHQVFRSAPIPSPKEFEGYKRVNPDFPERIFKQFEEDSIANRELQKEAQVANIELNKKSLEADIAFEKRSQWMAFILMAGFLLGTIILAYLDKDNAALVTGISTAVFAFKGVFAKNQSVKMQDDDDQTKKIE